MYPDKLDPAKVRYYPSRDFFHRHFNMAMAFSMPNYSIGMHMQEFFEVNIITRGSGMHYIEENKVPATVGDVFIIPPLVNHGYAGGEGFDVFHVLISKRFMEKNVSDLGPLPSFYTLFEAEPRMRQSIGTPLYLSLSGEQFEKISALLEKMKRYKNKSDITDALILENMTMVLIALLCRTYTENESNHGTPYARADADFMKSLAYIEERYFEKITVSTLAEIARLSRSAYIRKFKEICKMPPAEYITKRRLDAAELLLKNSSLSIARVAEHTGFYDTAHFTKTFIAKRGISPSAVREKRD